MQSINYRYIRVSFCVGSGAYLSFFLCVVLFRIMSGLICLPLHRKFLSTNSIIVCSKIVCCWWGGFASTYTNSDQVGWHSDKEESNINNKFKIPLQPLTPILSFLSLPGVDYKLCLTHDLLSPAQAVISPSIFNIF